MIMMAGTFGWIMEAPAATAYAVLPVGVDTITPKENTNTITSLGISCGSSISLLIHNHQFIAVISEKKPELKIGFSGKRAKAEAELCPTIAANLLVNYACVT